MKLIEINIKINFKEKFPKTYKRYVRYRFRRYLKRHFSLGVWREEINEKGWGAWERMGSGNGYAHYYLPFLRKYTNDGTIKEKYDIMKAVSLIPTLKEFAQNEEVKLLKYINKKL